jgi:hypothetical protein
MSDIDALRHTIEAFAHLEVAKRSAENEEVEEALDIALNRAVNTRCEVINTVRRELANGIEGADEQISEK